MRRRPLTRAQSLQFLRWRHGRRCSGSYRYGGLPRRQDRSLCLGFNWRARLVRTEHFEEHDHNSRDPHEAKVDGRTPPKGRFPRLRKVTILGRRGNNADACAAPGTAHMAPDGSGRDFNGLPTLRALDAHRHGVPHSERCVSPVPEPYYSAGPAEARVLRNARPAVTCRAAGAGPTYIKVNANGQRHDHDHGFKNPWHTGTLRQAQGRRPAMMYHGPTKAHNKGAPRPPARREAKMAGRVTRRAATKVAGEA